MYWQCAGLNKQVKVRNDLAGFLETLQNNRDMEILKLSDFSLTEAYTEPNFVYSRFVIGYCSTVVLIFSSTEIQKNLSP